MGQKKLGKQRLKNIFEFLSDNLFFVLDLWKIENKFGHRKTSWNF